MKRLAVLTSGGDAPGMNAAIRAVARLSAARGAEVLGVEDGYQGLIEGRFIPLTERPREGTSEVRPVAALDLHAGTGGTELGSTRCKAFLTREGRARAAASLQGIDGLVVIGGNGSLAGATHLSREHGIRVVGIPASIDNDIACTSMALGVDTALNTIVEACERISDTARAHRRAFVVEVMGRDSGYLATAAALAVGADGVLVPEAGRSEDDVLRTVEALIVRGFAPGSSKRRVLVLKAEGVGVPCTRLVRELQTRIDTQLPGVDVRATVLGHLVRGGSPSYFDRMLAGRFALAAIEALRSGARAEMVSYEPTVTGGAPTNDPSVFRFSLERVIAESAPRSDEQRTEPRPRLSIIERLEGELGL